MSDNQTNRLPGGADERLDHIITVVSSIDERLQKLEKSAEERQYDTKPIWERALQEIAETRSEMREGFAALKKEIRDTNRQMRAINNTLLKMQADYVDLDDRVDNLDDRVEKLESKAS